MRRILSIFILIFASSALAGNDIQNYQRIFLPIYTTDGKPMVAIRVFKMNKIPSFLIVDPYLLTTQTIPITALYPKQLFRHTKKKPFYHWKLASTPYYQLLIKNTSPPYPLENQGITHAKKSISKGNILTIDLCPSSHFFEVDFFKQLVVKAEKTNKAVPVTIAISGLWLLGHPEEFKWLQSVEKEKKLDITWANHSFSHLYYKDLSYSENFMRDKSTNVDTEILLTEQYLLEAGELPSVFFRFPGLVANHSLIKKIRTYGLIPLGTDAWIADLQARHQQITPGGVILVHGNNNEQAGIRLIKPLLKNMTLLDIKNSL